jgi:hypothetical protein
MNKKLINIKNIDKIKNYPIEFINFCDKNNLHPPTINSKRGKSLSVMLDNQDNYWNRDTCNEFCSKFKIETKDSIQLFNKHEQFGIKTSGEKGKYYIMYPFELSNKHKMRKNFKFDGTEQQKNSEIDKIKSTILNDYINVPNNKWQLGHKNPDSIDNTNKNLVLQPPIQSKYRDKYIFLDSITKMPTPKTLKKLYEKNKCPLTKEQLKELKIWLNALEL